MRKATTTDRRRHQGVEPAGRPPVRQQVVALCFWQHALVENQSRKLMSHEDLLKMFHCHIVERAADFGLVPANLPSMGDMLSSRGNESWFPIAGMYGGFSYSLVENEHEALLNVSSWCRVVGGSERHCVISACSITNRED